MTYCNSLNLTVGIPSYQGDSKLVRLITSLNEAASHHYTSENRLSVIVLLDGSTDKSREMLDSTQHYFSYLSVKWHWQKNAGRSAARNKIIDLCNSNILWFLDDDTTVSSAALETHLYFNRNTSPVVMGPCRSGVTSVNNWFYKRYHQLDNNTHVTMKEFFFSAANASAPIGIWNTHKFDTQFMGHGFEDYDVGVRMLKSGVPISFSFRAEVKHTMEHSNVEEYHRLVESGVNLVRFCKKHETFWNWALNDSEISSTRRIAFLRIFLNTKTPSVTNRIVNAYWILVFRLGNTRWKNSARKLALMHGIISAGGNNALKKYIVGHE